MKGMNRVKRGTGFRGLLNYQFEHSGDGHDEPGRLIGGNMSGTTPAELAKEFGAFRRLRPDIEKPVWHNSLRLPPGDELPDEGWTKFADDYMLEMGFDPDHPRVYIKHDDESAIHITACRVSASGKVYLGRNENLKSTRVIAELEHRHGLRITPGVRLDEDGKVIMPDKRQLKKNEVEKALRTGEEPPRQKLQRIIDEAKQGNPSAVQFAERLEAAGVTAVANLAKTGKMNGFSFEIDGIPFKGSQLGKSYGWGQLSKEVTYDQATDREELERFSSAARRSEIDQGATEGDREHAAAPTDAAEPGRPSEPARAPGAVVGIADRREPGRDPAGRSGGDEGGETARPDGGEAGQGGEAARANIPEIAGIQPGTGEVQAPQPLASRFNFKPADSGAYQRVLDLGGALVKNPAHRAKLDAWGQQHATLQAPAYRLTLVARRDGLRPYNMGKGKGEDGGEKTYTGQEIAQMLPTLSRQNARGYDIYITPIDAEHHYMVIDDMTAATVARLKNSGFEPTLIQTSSEGNQQCVLKVPRKPDQKDEQKLANQLVQHFNRELGDPNFSGVIHPFRMAGFSNKKPGRGDFFTRILQGGHRICGRAAQAMEEMREGVRKRLQAAQDAKKQLDAEKAQAAEKMRLDALWQGGGNHQDRLCKDAYQAVLRQVEAAGWALDLSRVDFKVAKLLHQRGLSDQTIERLLTEHSPSLHDRHSNPADYARRTVQNALRELSLEVERQAQRSRNTAHSGYDRKGDSSSMSRPKG